MSEIRVEVPTELHKRLKHIVVDEGTNIQKVVIRVLEAGLTQIGQPTQTTMPSAVVQDVKPVKAVKPVRKTGRHRKIDWDGPTGQPGAELTSAGG